MPVLIQSQVPLAPLNTWQVGGAADHFAEPANESELRELLQIAKNNHWPVTLIGGGSNVLISDKGVDGLVISTKKMNRCVSEVRENQLIIEAEAGVGKSEILKIYLKHKLAPALFLAGLPGDVGAGVVMNAGVGETTISPREFGEIVKSFKVMKTDQSHFPVVHFKKEDVSWSYRHSLGWQPGIIIQVTLAWPIEIKPDILEEVRLANRLRFQKQPLDLPSCGSVFINPSGHKAAQLIDQCVLKGFTIGGAQVSMKHANFIVNVNKATALDIHKVIEHVKKTVLDQKGVQLKTEVVYLGRW